MSIDWSGVTPTYRWKRSFPEVSHDSPPDVVCTTSVRYTFFSYDLLSIWYSSLLVQ